MLELKLLDFGVTAEVTAVYPGPVITRFEIQPAAGVKVSRISNLAKDLARSLAVISVRVVEVIPGKSVVGIEIPNEDREIVNFREVLSSKAFEQIQVALTLALGHDISGQPVVADLAKMPHLLVAGTTGSGKSVGVNSMLLSLLYKSGPADVRLILVDPKMLELSVYDGIPHLLTPVITDMKDAANGLRWCVAEMERRYKLMAALGVRNLAGYNRKVEDAIKAGPRSQTRCGPRTRFSPRPMRSRRRRTWRSSQHCGGHRRVRRYDDDCRQEGRAADRPYCTESTGRGHPPDPGDPATFGGCHHRPDQGQRAYPYCFPGSSKVDSRTILDQGGAEQLLGHGDMLYLPPGSGVPNRVHGAFCCDEEVHRVVADWKRRGEPLYIDGLLDEGSSTPVTPGNFRPVLLTKMMRVTPCTTRPCTT